MEKKRGVIPEYEDDIFISNTHVDNDKYAKDHPGWVDDMHESLGNRMEKKRGVIPEYEDDIFISYTHVDNDKYAKDHQGWVDDMHESLGNRLCQLLGEKPAIWRDPKLHGNDAISDTLMMKLRNIAIFVAVLSPRYLNSEWCRKELAEFCRTIRERNPIRFHGKPPIFKVVKTPVNMSACPDELRKLRGYLFYEEDPFGGRPNEFGHEMSCPTFWSFRQRLEDLAWDIKAFIDSLQETPSGRPVVPTGKSVYLAVTARDLDNERDEIRRELQAYGHRVLPDGDFPSEPAKLREAISEDLGKSDLSIHMIGKDYDCPNQSGQSLIRLQYELAIERGHESKFAQVMWIPRKLKHLAEEQRQLIDTLRVDARNHHIEVFEERLEDLKTNIRIKLRQLEEVEQRSTATGAADPKVYAETGKLAIYLMNDYEDYDATAQLREFLYDQKVVVLRMPATSEEGQAEAARQLHLDYLKQCHAVIVFYGRASDLWMCQKENELRRNRRGGSTRLLGEAVYLSDPTTGTKQSFRSIELTVIREQDKFPPQELLSFLQELRSKQAKLEGADN